MKMLPKIIFIDRDGTLINEPADKQIDAYDKFALIPGVIPALLQFKSAGFKFVLVSNQDGLGTESLPDKDFLPPHELMLNIFKSQGIDFLDVLICPHFEADECDCRKPKLGLVNDYVIKRKFDLDHSYVIGDRQTDLQLAENMGIKGFILGQENTETWEEIVKLILDRPKVASIVRNTNETNISISVNLYSSNKVDVDSGIPFFDHMLEQLAMHGGFSLTLKVKGDLEVDDHHSVEDVALALGQALAKALDDKRGIGRYGFLLPMDEALAQVAIDLSGRPYCDFKGDFPREKVGGLATELVSHFFNSFAQTLGAAIHISVTGENAHHMVEAVFKSVGRALRQAFERKGSDIASTKGVL